MKYFDLVSSFATMLVAVGLSFAQPSDPAAPPIAENAVPDVGDVPANVEQPANCLNEVPSADVTPDAIDTPDINLAPKEDIPQLDSTPMAEVPESSSDVQLDSKAEAPGNVNQNETASKPDPQNRPSTNVDPNTPSVPIQADAAKLNEGRLPSGKNALQSDTMRSKIDFSRTAPWRMQQHNNEWWYYTPTNQWMYYRGGEWQQYAANDFVPFNSGQYGNGTRYTAGYRGVDPGYHQDTQTGQNGSIEYQGQSYAVRYDCNHRAYICVNGAPVYVQNDSREMSTDNEGMNEPQTMRTETNNPNSSATDNAVNPPQGLDESVSNEAVPANPVPPNSTPSDVGDSNVDVRSSTDTDPASIQGETRTNTQLDGEINKNP